MKPARLIVLLIALVAGAVAAYLASRSSLPPAPVQVAAPTIQTTEVLVAKLDIGMGQTVKADDLLWQIWPRAAANSNFVLRADKPNAIEQLAGSIARTPFVTGEPIREAKLIRAGGSGFMAAILPSGKRAISTDITPETGAGGFILPNDRVDVILTRRERETDKGAMPATSEIIMSDVRVLAIDQTVQEKDGQRVVVGKTATLELGPRQSETLAQARQSGTLTLALRSLADAARPAAGEEDDQRARRDINMVRFGVSTTTTPR
jgi:pilus assembly protein CpaB